MSISRTTATNHRIVQVDRNYRIDRNDSVIVVTDVDVDLRLPDDVLIGHTVRIVAAAGDVVVHSCSADIWGEDQDGDFLIPRGGNVAMSYSFDGCNCTRQWIPSGLGR